MRIIVLPLIRLSIFTFRKIIKIKLEFYLNFSTRKDHFNIDNNY
jgi:hypothetical protein